MKPKILQTKRFKKINKFLHIYLQLYLALKYFSKITISKYLMLILEKKRTD